MDAGGAALDSPQNVLAEFEDVPVLPLCCPRLITVDVFDPEDRRMRPSHDGSWCVASIDPTSNPRYSLTYEDENSKSLRVIDWGPATGTHLVDPERRLQVVECWQVLWVNAYVRHFPRRSQLCGEPGWVHWATFPVMQWSEIPNVFKDYFATGGLYTRVSFHVEAWIWTKQCGWTCDDQI